ncbi:unnamed protein product, partial [Rotaria sp. Silwood1]
MEPYCCYCDIKRRLPPLCTVSF